jgi:hypothetical protein
MSEGPEEYCRAFETWAKAYITELPTDSPDKTAERREFAEHWRVVEIAIHKSNLLERLIYHHEPLRTEMCPVHKGRWSGCVWENLPCGCQSGANVTGWLPSQLADGNATPPLQGATEGGELEGK